MTGLEPAEGGDLADAAIRVVTHGRLTDAGGRITGCWWLSAVPRTSPFARGPGATATRNARTLLVKGVRRDGTRMAGVAVRVAVGADAARAVASALDDATDAPARLGDCLLEMVSIGGTYPGIAGLPPVDGEHRLDPDDVAAADPASLRCPAGSTAAASAAVASMRRHVRGFLEGQGEAVLGLLHAAVRATRKDDRERVAAALGGTWHLIDPLCDPEAPLLRALRDFPLLARGLVREALRDPADFRRDALAGNVAAVVAREATVRRSLPYGLAMRLPELSAAMVRDMRRNRWPLDGSAFDAGMEDAVMAPVNGMLPLVPLPGNWVPRTDAGWDAFAALRPALDEVGVPAPSMAAHLAMGGDWEAFARRVTRASGGLRPEAAVRGIRDVHNAFARQVVLPALLASVADRASQDDPGMPATWLARSILSDGRTLSTGLETSREWHRRRTAIEAVVTSVPGRRASWTEWDPWLPDHASGGLGLRILAGEEALLAEGQAMGNCVGGYSVDCGRGTCRIASILEVRGDGSTRRLATADLRFVRHAGADMPVVIELSGSGNGIPDPRCRPFVDAYVGLFRDGTLRVGGNPSPWDPGRDERDAPFEDRMDEVGYDWLHEGNRERVLAAWRPVLPPALRGATVADYDAMVARMGLDVHVMTPWSTEPVTVAACLERPLRPAPPEWVP